ncbi:MAG: hypothetical protein J6U13_00415 [Salinivirgaceae bacterium]|nr:hypothetical protein [Salinivirgaceae bacterium]
MQQQNHSNVGKLKQIILAVALLAAMRAGAQDGHFEAMGNASVMQSGLWSVNNNQAGLANLQNFTVGVSYQNRFQLAETSTKSVAAAIHTQTGNFGLSFNRFGYSQYSENSFGLAYARTFGEWVSAGLQFDYLNINQPSAYGNNGVFLFEVGLIAKPITNLQIGAHIYNPTKAKMAEYEDERVNTSFRLGASYFFSNIVQLAAEVEKTMQTDLRCKVGIEYQLISNLYLRTGFRSKPNEFCFGAGYTFKGLTFDFSFATHQYLPMSTQISLMYSL